MKLFLIRHAETVDNVAGLYAGVRDSHLTVFGVDQADRLGQYLAKTGVVLTHIFASPLTRTTKTADAIRKAQLDDASSSPPDIVKVPALIEQDFGYYEGKPFQARAADSKKSGRESHRDKHKDDVGFVDVESRESMANRADKFLEEHLFPLFSEGTATDEYTVAIISHGMLLSTLWRRILLRLPRKSLTIAPDVTGARGDVILEHLGGWSNTGYLQLLIRKNPETIESTNENIGKAQEADTATPTLQTPVPPPVEPDAAFVVVEATPTESEISPPRDRSRSSVLAGYSTRIVAIDSKQHLNGLKRQRGGIGRSAHDASQKKLDRFFKRKRTD